MSRRRNTPQPRLARVAAAIGDPARAAMLARLLDGRYHTAKELAAHAGVAASTASQHLRMLIEENLLHVRPRGRHRYFMLADGNVAHALEALLRVADGVAPQAVRWERPAMRGLRFARTCYGHLAGELGVQLCRSLLRRGWVRPLDAQEPAYGVTTDGLAGMRAWGVAVSPDGDDSAARGGRPLLYGCVDWSERRDHFAGPLAVSMLDTFLERGWLRRIEGSRELKVTPSGQSGLVDSLRDAAPAAGGRI